MSRPSFSSDTYPYERVQPGVNRLEGAEFIPLKILKYILDLPDSYGYEPIDDNSRPRVRIAKYLWYEGENPLGKPLPTPQQKLSMLFDGTEPDINTNEQKEKHPKDYRIFPQIYWGQAELRAQVVLKCYMGRTIPVSPLEAKLAIVFEILVNSNLEGTTRTDAYSRAYAIETALVSALAGVNIAGIGTVSFSRREHIDCGSGPLHDNGTHVGRTLTLSTDWMDGDNDCVVGGCN